MRERIALQSISCEIDGERCLCFPQPLKVRTRPRVAFEKLDLIGFIAGNDCGARLRRGDISSTLAVSSRYRRFSRFHIRLGNLRIRLSSLVQFVVELVLCFLKLLDRLTHSAGKLGQFLCSK
jgi:hypothetical protein